MGWLPRVKIMRRFMFLDGTSVFYFRFYLLDYTCRARWPEGQCVQRRKNTKFVRDDFAIMQSWYQDINIYNHLLSSPKHEPKTLKTPLQEHQKELETQPFERSHVDNLAILQSWSCNPAILISISAIICSHLQNRTQNSENTFTGTL